MKKREILVVKKHILFPESNFQGFMPIIDRNFLETILSEFEYQERNDDLERSPYFQQIIPYVWIVNKKRKEIFLYQRSAKGGEERLHNKYSGGVGGHIDKNTEELSKDPITDAMMRELKEEVIMNFYPAPKFIGFIKDDSNEVGLVHFGVVAIAETDEDVRPAEDMSSGKFYTIDEIDHLFSNPKNIVETWTSLSWPFIKKYLDYGELV